MNESAYLINSLSDFFGFQNYLEIGVQKGITFLDVSCKNKIGVDPNFLFDTSIYANKNTFFFRSTSDVFFNQIIRTQFTFMNEKPNFDLVFIDGMHTLANSYQDFLNSLYFINSKSIIIIDDVIPFDPYAALPDRIQSSKLRKLAKLKNWTWQGDVFKTIFMIHDFHPEFSFVTIADYGYPRTCSRGNPRTLIWKTKYPSRRKQLFLKREAIEKLSYFDLLDNCHILNPINISMLFSYIYNDTDGIEINIPIDKIIPDINTK